MLARDTRGATIVEFAIIVPVLLMMMMFLFDTGFYFYARSILGGEVQAAGRASSLETATEANQEALNETVRTAVKRLVRNGEVDFTRTAYKNYARAQATAERFSDANGDGHCNNNEIFDDENGNKIWDRDAGVVGQGGAKDVVVYTATLEYDRLFPMATLLGWNNRVSITASTLLRNQPFDKQSTATPGKCP